MSKKAKLSPVGTELSPFHDEIKQILQQARSKAKTAVNSAMVEAYWLIGKFSVPLQVKGLASCSFHIGQGATGKAIRFNGRKSIMKHRNFSGPYKVLI